MNPIIRTAQRAGFVVLAAAYGAVSFAQSTAVLGETAPSNVSYFNPANVFDYFTI